MATTLAQVLQHFGAKYLSEHSLSTAQARAWRAIVACRTAALGGQQLACDGCGAPQWRWHSCRNRHCPQCQSRARDAWRSARLAELLNVPYSHLVFTLPHELNALASLHPRWVYDTLMQCTAATLSEFAANPRWLGGTGAFTLVLHTWTQDLRRHLHVHALMACGALQCDTESYTRWVRPRRAPNFLFPVKALSNVFRGKFLQVLGREGSQSSRKLPSIFQVRLCSGCGRSPEDAEVTVKGAMRAFSHPDSLMSERRRWVGSRLRATWGMPGTSTLDDNRNATRTRFCVPFCAASQAAESRRQLGVVLWRSTQVQVRNANDTEFRS